MDGSALVLEGGGMRGVFTAGVLDAFIEKEVEIPYVVGVSMGAYIGASYLAKQRHRALKVIMYASNNRDFMDLKRILKVKSIVNLDFIFENVDKNIFPFDEDIFFDRYTEHISVVTNCITGKAEYHCKSNRKEQNYKKSIMASCAYPLLTETIYINGIPYLDGGISDSIPINYVLNKTNKKMIVLLTHTKGFKESEIWYHKGSKLAFKKFPEISKDIIKRSNDYNKNLKLIEKMEKREEIFVIRPNHMEMGIAETDILKVLKHYEDGYHVGLESIDKIKKW